MNEEVRESTSIKVIPENWKKFKILCIQLDVDLSDKINELITKELEKRK